MCCTLDPFDRKSVGKFLKIDDNFLAFNYVNNVIHIFLFEYCR